MNTNRQTDKTTYAEQNGYSGTQWDRPGWQKLLEMVERDYLRMGLYREMFAEKGIRYIAVGGGMDSINGDDDLLPIREIMSEWYARDTSRKIKSALHNKGRSGKHMTNAAVYGYKKSPDDKNVWLIDEEASIIVKRIFQMALDGMGPYQIARRLSAEKVEKPSAYFARTKDWTFDGKGNAPYKAGILR